MDKESRGVVYPKKYELILTVFFEYGIETFGLHAAQTFIAQLIFGMENLSIHYELYPEYRFLPTKSNSTETLF